MKKPIVILANCNPSLNIVQNELVEIYNAKKAHNPSELLKVLDIKPDYIFFLHWSWIIPESIFGKHTCIVFHMTDLPYGRGGSPMQNLIISGHKNTKLSALRVNKGLDTGDIYLKKDLTLLGTATEIFERAGEVIKEMIKEIIEKKIIPTPQIGESTVFSRRKPEESLITNDISDIEKLYDFIRMLDADNYPKAFLETDKFKLEFYKGEIIGLNELKANVRIIKK